MKNVAVYENIVGIYKSHAAMDDALGMEQWKSGNRVYCGCQFGGIELYQGRA